MMDSGEALESSGRWRGHDDAQRDTMNSRTWLILRIVSREEKEKQLEPSRHCCASARCRCADSLRVRMNGWYQHVRQSEGGREEAERAGRVPVSCRISSKDGDRSIGLRLAIPPRLGNALGGKQRGKRERVVGAICRGSCLGGGLGFWVGA
jgi:hypothetical protein